MLNNSLRPVPFVKLLIPFILGILIAAYSQIPYLSYGMIPCLGLLLYFTLKKGQLNQQLYFSITTMVSFVILGYALMKHQQQKNEDQISHLIDQQKTVSWIGVVQSAPSPQKNINATIELRAIQKGKEWIEVNQKIKAYFKRDTTTLGLQYGDKIIVSSRLQATKDNPNPHSFNYAQYLAYQGIHYSSYVPAERSQILAQDEGHPVLAWSYATRNKALKALKIHLNTSNEFAVGAALILGYKDEITATVKEAYSNTGAMHVLAVSGLHVGILYFFIAFIFGLYKGKHPLFPWLKLIINMLVIWSFALITGASPSVLRAATMFSFVALGSTLNRNSNIYNTLATSAFFLLCIHPYLLFSPGFQLSYLAVIGIVFFQPLIYKSWYVRNRIGDYIWNLTAVSLAAQVVTVPISLFYFNQFPSYFMLSGLVVIPAALIIMIIGLLTIFSSILMSSAISTFLGLALYHVIWFVNATIFFISQLPYHLIENIYLPFHELLIAYIAIISLMCWFRSANIRYFRFMLFIFCLLSVSYAYRNISAQQKSEIVFYDSKGVLIDFFHHNKSTTFKSDTITTVQENFAAKGHRIASRYFKKDSIKTIDGEQFLRIGEHRYFLLSQPYFDQISQQRIEVDGIIIHDNPYINFEALHKEFSFKYLIADGSNYEKNVKKWRFALSQQATSNQPLYYTKEEAIILQNKNDAIIY